MLQTRNPDSSLSGFVESFWILINPSDQEKEGVVLPDGRIDTFFSDIEPFHSSLMGVSPGFYNKKASEAARESLYNTDMLNSGNTPYMMSMVI